MINLASHVQYQQSAVSVSALGPLPIVDSVPVLFHRAYKWLCDQLMSGSYLEHKGEAVSHLASTKLPDHWEFSATVCFRLVKIYYELGK